jgi:CubicO group peptidase (beta-lactamase class C family)
VTPDPRALLAEGVESRIFPCARAVVRWRGQVVFDEGAGGATADTLFDVASLTKVIGTTASFLALWSEGWVDPVTPVMRYFPGSAVGQGGVTLGDLLYHRAGVPAFVPFFAEVMREAPRLLDPGCPPALRETVRRGVLARALATPVAAPRGRGAVYSDVGFIVLGECLAAAAGTPLDRLVAERVVTRLGLGVGFRRLSAIPRHDPEQARIAPTGTGRPREPAPGQEGLWEPIPPRPSPPGEVDDDNAWVMDGVAGHAGLFGRAADVAAFGQALLDDLAGAGRLAPRALWEEALARDPGTPGSTRAMGFDTLGPGDPREGASAGRYLGARPPGAVGHLGFTGVSLWIDRALELVVALCTNRTALGRAELGIQAFRPRLHDAVVEALGITA